MIIGENDPDKWLARKRNGRWWIWAPRDYLPLVELPTFAAVLAWHPTTPGQA